MNEPRQHSAPALPRRVSCHRMRRVMRLAPLLLLLQVACTSLPPASETTSPASAQEAPAAAPSAAVTTQDSAAGSLPSLPTPVEAIETTRSTVRGTAEWLARGVDSWFGDRPFEDGGKVTDGRASVGLLKRETEKLEYSLRFNARFKLPNFERRTYLFVGRDNLRDLVSDKPGALSNQNRLLPETDEDPSFFAGLGRDLSELVDLRVGFRSAKPYAQARYRQGWELGESTLLELRQTVFWTLRDKLGSTTAVSWDHANSPTVAMRWLSSATITQDTGRFEWSSVVGAYKSFGDRRVLSLEALVNGEEGGVGGASDYGLQSRWSQPIFEDRLFAEFVVGHFWPRKDVFSDRRGVWALGGNLKMTF